MDATSSESSWESKIAGLLSELSAVQSELLDVLSRKRKLLATADLAGLADLAPREQQILAALQACQDRRAALLNEASQNGLPGGAIRALAAALPKSQQNSLAPQIAAAKAQARLLEHQSLTNWVLVQRTLLHLSQMLEIIATGGRLQPTYGKSAPASTGGSLVDQAA